MALGHRKAMLIEQADNLVFCFWQFQADRERTAQRAVYDGKAVTAKAVMKSSKRRRKLFRC